MNIIQILLQGLSGYTASSHFVLQVTGYFSRENPPSRSTEEV